MSDDTIYAVSSGRPPAAIAVVRVSGPAASHALTALAGALPVARMATLRTLRAHSGEVLDRAIVLWFPGPASATGEDVAELHLHGGPAVVAAVFGALAGLGLRPAEPGEFTRRAVFNGRLDFNEAEGLADLLAAETEAQRRDAILRTTNVLGRRVQGWTERLVAMSAEVERAIDHDEDDSADVVGVASSARALCEEIEQALARPTAERLRDGVRVAIVGPVNAGKSSLFNALIGEDAAIVTPMPGTTRDVVERAIMLDGYPFLLSDTAGQRESDDPIERIGIERAELVAEYADIILDLSTDAVTEGRRLAIASKNDIVAPADDRLSVSAITGSGIVQLRALLVARGETSLPAPGEVALNTRQHAALRGIAATLRGIESTADPIVIADHLASARRDMDRLSGNAGIEEMFDTLFSRFCLGK